MFKTICKRQSNAATMLIIYMVLIPAAVAYTTCVVKPVPEPTCGKNASYIDCPSACPSTCKSPNEGNCNKKCKPKGCHCNPSYLLSKKNGQCILPTDCPGGNPCSRNETFVACSIGCPNNYCPVDDSLAILICDPAWPCPSGCSCKPNYKRKSVKNPRCILASECPPVKCTRPNEEWNPCTNSCLKENCYDLKVNDTACKPWGCEPRCACKEGFYRNDDGICVHASQCYTCDVPIECRRTCAEPNPENCPYQTVTENIKGCKCKPGFILSDKDGECIEIEKCSQQSGCNKDPNAFVTSCPPPCPATCQSPRDAPCKKMCLDVGCRCKNGYILSKLNGLCIKPDKCPGGNPCGKNATFSNCSNRCPNSYCPKDDSPPKPCSPLTPCPAGCTCKLNHRRKSQQDDQCIVASECPPVNCTRPNEVWAPCPSDCLSESCKDAGKKPPVCNTLVYNCQPKCVCKPNTYRDKNKVCVPVEKCPAPPPIKCGVNEEYSTCKITCPPQFCNNSYTDYGICPNDTKCEPGCNCIKDHLRDFDGKCVLNDNCPPPRPTCGSNETLVECGTACPPTCQTQKPEVCTDQCIINVCQCKPPYILSEPNGQCILPEDCPAPSVKCSGNEVEAVVCLENVGEAADCKKTCVPKTDPTPCGGNATYVDCASSCPPTCQTPKPEACIALCKPNVTCQCKPSYVLSPNGDCILPKDCPAMPTCGSNETLVECGTACPPTCQTPKPEACTFQCIMNVCQCKPPYMLSESKGKCILPEDCPKPPTVVCGENEVETVCKTRCPTDTCDSGNRTGVCIPGPCRPGCNCKENYARGSNGKCIPKEKCPKPPTPCGGNATYVDCASSCPPTCQTPKPEACIALCKPNVTCQCKPSYVLSPNGDCILPDDCPTPPPVVCGENEVATVCKKTCPSDSCDSDNNKAICRPGPCRPGCNCKENYARGSNGKCIPKEKCPKKPNICGANATLVDCASSCPPTCQSPRPKACIALCNLNACQCKPTYILSKPNGECILPKDCPAPPSVVCGENEVATVCKKTCPSDSCDSDNNKTVCRPGPCRPGCNCKENYARGSNGKCIPKEKCPNTRPTCGSNETLVECGTACPPTCQTPKPEACTFQCIMNVCQCKPPYMLSEPNGKCILPEDCPKPPPVVCGENEVETVCKTRCPTDTCDSGNRTGVCIPGPCRPGCNCKENYARNSNGKCIAKEKCPKEPIICGGNSTLVDCASSCPPTCQTPNPKSCIAQCNTNSCQCKPSYILSKPNGECILPEDCPGGSPCAKNETFVSCNMGCPNNYCPVQDSLAILICDPPRPCPSGCSCKLNYKRKSLKDPQCILAEECPPLKCTRPNEEWNTCPTSCLKENCKDLKLNTACKPSRTNCQPRCTCKEGFYRNASRVCVPASECFPTKTCDVTDECKATCAEPNPKNCPYRPASENIEGCNCKPGYILSQKNGKCIKVEDCPKDSGCNGDTNAFTTECPPPCPSTCESPNELPCRKSCLPVGCKCKEGFILSKLNGLCIKPDNCTGGNPCKNGLFSSCNNKCAYNYCPVDDSPPNYNCTAPSPCLSGCICRFDHRKKSVNDDRCIEASKCPPVNCTRPNEIWYSCPSACLSEDCEDAGKETTVCNTFVLNCQPGCFCKPNTYRDKNKICVPVDKCPKPPLKCDENEVEICKFDENCDTDAEIQSICKPTCDCKKNYTRDSNGKCVLDKKQPSNNNEPNKWEEISKND